MQQASKTENNLPKVSIVTVTFNAGPLLEKTLGNLQMQDYPNKEIVVVDGKSTDDTIITIKRYAHSETITTWVSEPDRGIYDAMNKGISRCTGDVVGILNSDDYFTSDDVLQNVAHTFSSNETIDAVYGDIHFINDNNPDKIVRYYSSKMFRPFWLRFGFMPAHPSFYVKRKIYQEYGDYSLDYKIAADYDMMVRLFYKHKIQAKYIKKDFVTMRTGGMSTKNVRNRLLITKEDVKACRAYGMYTNQLMISVKYLYKIFEFL